MIKIIICFFKFVWRVGGTDPEGKDFRLTIQQAWEIAKILEGKEESHAEHKFKVEVGASRWPESGRSISVSITHNRHQWSTLVFSQSEGRQIIKALQDYLEKGEGK